MSHIEDLVSFVYLTRLFCLFIKKLALKKIHELFQTLQ